MRPNGMRVAEISVLLLQDPKVVRLKRLGGDSAQLAFVRFLLTCWQWGERLSVDDQEPDHAASIREVDLVDEDGCIRESAWDDWYGVRLRALEAAREAGRRGGLASAEARLQRPLKGRSSEPQAQTDRLSYRQSHALARVNGSEDPTTKKNGSMKEILKEMGLAIPNEEKTQ
jgi:hypothetical protein